MKPLPNVGDKFFTVCVGDALPVTVVEVHPESNNVTVLFEDEITRKVCTAEVLFEDKRELLLLMERIEVERLERIRWQIRELDEPKQVTP